MATQSLLQRLQLVNERAEALQEVQELKETMEEKDRDYMRQIRLLRDAQEREKGHMNDRIRELINERDKTQKERDQARRAFNQALEDLHMSKDEADRLNVTIEGALHEREEILKEVRTKEEQIRQRDQVMEDLERQIAEQREVLNDSSRTEEEHEAAERELETLQERVAELQRQKDNLERELGLTTKEKIKRLLIKYGVPLAFAVAISATVGVIISMLKGTGAAVKKVGAGLTNLGKKMAAALPGLFGSVLSLVLRTGGELLKFVGNNIWILVVAIGMVLLKRMKV